MRPRMKQEDFIIKSKTIHGGLYNYSKVKYIGNKDKVIIICKEHGDFEQTPNNHLYGQGCYKCKNNSQKSNLKIFIEKSIESHGYRYDYSKSEYKNTRTDITIICKRHGEFLQKPDKHILGQGCNKCKIECNTLTNEYFIKKSILKHVDKYNYSKSSYKYTNKKVIIICKEHGEFLQTPMTHISGSGCPKCTFNSKKNVEIFKKQSIEKHNDKYCYDKTEYISSHKKVIIICKEHGEFLQTPNSHISGSGCQKCSFKFGKLENEWLDKFNIPNEYRQYKIGRYIVDGFDPNNNTIYEFNGDYWHGNPIIYKKYDRNKNNNQKFGELYDKTIKKSIELKEMGYNIISIWENEYLKERSIS